MGYAGEEVGLLGSQDIARKYRRDNDSVVAVMQFDMTMFPDSKPMLQLVNDFTSEPLNRLIGRLLDHYVKMPWELTTCGYACSDHASWTRSGYAASFPFEGAQNKINTNIHSEKDVLGIIDLNYGLHFLKLALAYSVELAEPTQN